jgi:hypothetical protein
MPPANSRGRRGLLAAIIIENCSQKLIDVLLPPDTLST